MSQFSWFHFPLLFPATSTERFKKKCFFHFSLRPSGEREDEREEEGEGTCGKRGGRREREEEEDR